MSLTIKTLGRGRRVAAGSLIAVAALGLTACQQGSDDGASRSSDSSTHSAARNSGTDPGADVGTESRPQSSASAPSFTEAHTSTGAASDRCTAEHMSLSLGASDIGAGNIRYPLVFTNKGTTTCSLRGYPGVSLMLRDGSVIGEPANREGGAGGAVTLRPGQSAHAILHTVNDGVSDTPCWKKSQLVYVYPPGSKASMTTNSDGLRVCGGRFTVTTTESGADG